jgi:hypothetical protein
MSHYKYPTQNYEYSIKEINPNTFTKNNNTNFTDDTVAIVGTAKYKQINSNSRHIIVSKYLHPFVDDKDYIQAEIIWFDSIIIDINDINKLEKLSIIIGGGNIWYIDIQYLLQIYKPETFDDKIKISFPKTLFLDTNKNNYITSIKLNEFLGIPLICLSYHELHFEISSSTSIKYDLVITSVQVNSNIKSELTKEGHEMNIINHIIIPSYYNKIKNISPFKFPFTNDDIINNDNIINCMNVLINKNIKNIIMDFPILINDLKNIIIEYLKIDDNIFNIIIDDDIQYNYLILFNKLKYVTGMAGAVYSLGYYNDEDYIKCSIISV